MTATIEQLVDATDDDVAALAEVLVDCVDGGASVNFLRPMPLADAGDWWRSALADPNVSHLGGARPGRRRRGLRTTGSRAAAQRQAPW